MAIAAVNQEVDRIGGTVLEWIQKMHAHSAAVALRKQVDRSSDSGSLRGLLAIGPRAVLLSREEYVSRVNDDTTPTSERECLELEERRDFMHQQFDELAGPGAARLTETAVLEDLARLDGSLTSCEVLAGQLKRSGGIRSKQFEEMTTSIDGGDRNWPRLKDLGVLSGRAHLRFDRDAEEPFDLGSVLAEPIGIVAQERLPFVINQCDDLERIGVPSAARKLIFDHSTPQREQRPVLELPMTDRTRVGL